MRLEQENDDLAHELVSSKIALRKDLDNVRAAHAVSVRERAVALRGTDLCVCVCVSGRGEGRRPE